MFEFVRTCVSEWAATVILNGFFTTYRYTKIVVRWLALLLCIREIQVSILCQIHRIFNQNILLVSFIFFLCFGKWSRQNYHLGFTDFLRLPCTRIVVQRIFSTCMVHYSIYLSGLNVLMVICKHKYIVTILTSFHISHCKLEKIQHRALNMMYIY